MQTTQHPPNVSSTEQSDTQTWYKRFVLWGVGAIALFWFLVRVIPKPSRAAYPCQRMAFPVASYFVLSLVGLWTAVFSVRHAQKVASLSLPIALSLLLLGGISSTFSLVMVTGTSQASPKDDAPNAPMGTARGLYPGRVTWTHNAKATSWDGQTGYWWEDKYNNQPVVDQMLSNNLRWLTNTTTDKAAWDALFTHFNQKHNRGTKGYQRGESIVIKINMNNMWSKPYATKQNQIDASPHMVLALLKQLINKAGIPPEAITVYDAIRAMSDVVFDPSHKAFPKVRFVDNRGEDGRTKALWVPDAIRYADGKTSSLPKSVVDATYQINMAILKRHAIIAPVTLCGKNYFGSIQNPSALHAKTMSWNFSMKTYTPIVDLMGHKHLGQKTMLFLLDGLYGAKSYNGEPKKWSMKPFNNHWPSSIFASQDIVAIDSVGFDFIWHETVTLSQSPNMRNGDRYLHEAAVAHKAPSGTVYDPEKDGTTLTSLGVHEHWNNADKKQYTRNLGTGNGIELLSSPPNNQPPTEPTQPDAGEPDTQEPNTPDTTKRDINTTERDTNTTDTVVDTSTERTPDVIQRERHTVENPATDTKSTQPKRLGCSTSPVHNGLLWPLLFLWVGLLVRRQGKKGELGF
tara:strand:+ start:4586 stop:6469 length:1884 start_codon:yes stop_codon:yes gene_type:complete